MKTFFLRSAITAAFSLVQVISALAQAAETPESVAIAYFTALQAGDWAKCAGYMHPEALASMKRSFTTIVNADKTGGAAKNIFGLKNNAEFSELSDAAVFEKLMDFIASAVPDIKTALSASTNTVLGKVSEGADLVHIVYRSNIKLESAEATQVDLISMKKSGTTWRALLTSDMEELFEKFAEGLTGK